MRSCIALSILGIVFITGTATAQVQGQFTVGSTAIVPKHACAYPVRSQYSAHQSIVEIILSEGLCDAADAITALDPHTQMINQEGLRSSNYVYLTVGPEGKVGMNATLSATMTQYLDSTVMGLKAELTVNTPNRVAGHIYNAQPVRTHGGETYQADFAIDVAVTRPPAGTKLPAGGGEPGKAFMALFGAIRKKDMTGIRARLAVETLAGLEKDYNTPEENRDYVVEILTAWLPKKNAKVVGGESSGDTAIIEVEGEVYEGTQGLYLARMVKGAGGWVMKEARMVGML
jgi:hypothetical protein